MSHEPKDLWDNAPSVALSLHQHEVTAIVLKTTLLLMPLLAIFLLAEISYLMWRDGSLVELRADSITISKKTSKSAFTALLEKKSSAYTFAVRHNENKTYKYYLRDAGIKIDTARTYAKARETQANLPFIQKLMFWKVINVPLSYTTDDILLRNFINTKMTVAVEVPINATLSTSSGDVVISREKNGTGYIVTNARQKLLATAPQLQDATFSMSKQTLSPAITATDLQSLTKKINDIAATPIALTVAGKIYSPSKPTIIKWFDPITTDTIKPALELNSGRVQEYVEKISAPYSRENRAQIQMRNEDDSTTILVSGRNGTGINNKADVVKDIADKLIEKKPIEKELTIGTLPFTTITTNDYDKWIHVDVTDKWMYAYEKDKLVRSVPISAGAPATPTVIGQYKIYRKLASRDMRGQNADGTNYFQPNVAWVSYFYKGYAIHGNYWRPDSWFGRVNSSHGCVSAQNNVIKWFYDWAPIGTPVITHY